MTTILRTVSAIMLPIVILWFATGGVLVGMFAALASRDVSEIWEMPRFAVGQAWALFLCAWQMEEPTP